jgi:NADH dehydrogenase
MPRDFRAADTRRARVILIEGGPRLLPGFQPDSSERALRQLQALGVEVMLNRRVTGVLPDGLELGGERLRSYNVIWAAGVRAAPLVANLGVELGPGGRVKVEADCSIPKFPNAFVIGDAAYFEEPGGHVVPGVSQGAMQMARFAARIILAELAGAGDARAHGFHYHDKGSMATIGKSRAVVEIGRWHYGGVLAWLTWFSLHITVLIGFQNRLAVLSSWMYGYLFSRRSARLITDAKPEPVKRLVPGAASFPEGPDAHNGDRATTSSGTTSSNTPGE